MSIIQRTLRTDSTSAAPLLLRLGLGAVFVGHGAQKLFGWWGGYGFEATAKSFQENMGFNPGWLYAALVGGALLILGLATRFASAQAAAIMAVAIWTAHRGSFFAPSGMEYPLTLLLIAVSLLLTGGGALSIDAHLAKPSKIAPKK